MSPRDGAPKTCLPTNCPGPSPSIKSDSWPSATLNDGDHLLFFFNIFFFVKKTELVIIIFFDKKKLLRKLKVVKEKNEWNAKF